MKSMRNFVQVWFGLAFLFYLSGCGPTKVPINVLKPAEVDMIGIKKIAIAEFTGEENSGSLAANLLTSKLMTTQHYEILEREKLEKVVEEHQLSMSGLINEDEAKQLGQFLGVDGLIFGGVSTYRVEPDERGIEKVTKKVWTGEYERDKNGNIKTEKTLLGIKVKKKIYKEVLVDEPYRIRRGSVTANLRIVNVETGQLVYSEAISRSYNSGKVLDSSSRTLPPKENILTNLMNQVLDIFVKQIAPHYITAYKAIEGGEGDIDVGKKFAKNGLWPEAQQAWLRAIKNNPNSTAALYNLGLAYEVEGKLDVAEKYYEKASALNPKDLYLKAISNIRKAKAEKERLRRQMEER